MENGKCRRTHGMCVRRRMQHKTQLAADFSVISRESERAQASNIRQSKTKTQTKTEHLFAYVPIW